MELCSGRPGQRWGPGGEGGEGEDGEGAGRGPQEDNTTTPRQRNMQVLPACQGVHCRHARRGHEPYWPESQQGPVPPEVEEIDQLSNSCAGRLSIIPVDSILSTSQPSFINVYQLYPHKYNIGPPSCECWFINTGEYNYLRTINHREIGVINWLCFLGSPTL